MSARLTEWLSEGQKNVPGTIQQPCGKLGYAYLQPDRFPTIRLYFSISDWSLNQKQACKQGALAVFDVPPQDYRPESNPVAANVRVLGRR